MDDGLFYTFPQQVPVTEEQLERDLAEGRVYRLADAYFKFVFGRQERSDLFIDLLNAIVFPGGERAFSKVEFLDREFSPERMDGRGFRLDLVGLLDGCEQVNLEVQVKNEPDYLRRSVYYLALLHSGQLNRGRRYYEINRTISIHITGFDLLANEPDFRNGYSLRNDTSGKILNEDVSIVFIELPKYVKQLKIGRKPVNKLERWLGYLAGLEGTLMTNIAHDEPMIERALEIEKMFLMDYKQRIAYIRDIRAMLDEANHDDAIKRQALEEGRAEGEAKGKIEGRAEGKIEIAKKLLSLGDPIGKVVLATGLSDEEVRNISSQLNQNPR